MHGELPKQTFRDDGDEPLLSWRVHILPFIEQTQLYEQFHLDEPWDSDHNIQLVSKMPKLFATKGFPPESGKTVFQVPTGDEMLFNEDGPVRFRDALDGLSATAMMVEVEPAVQWTRPSDWNVDLNAPLKGIRFDDGQAALLMGDGGVKTVSRQMPVDKFRAMLTKSSGD